MLVIFQSHLFIHKTLFSNKDLEKFLVSFVPQDLQFLQSRCHQLIVVLSFAVVYIPSMMILRNVHLNFIC